MAPYSIGNVASSGTTFDGVFWRCLYRECLGTVMQKEGDTVGTFYDNCVCGRVTDMKRKGRYVLEAAVLLPFLCLMLVYSFYFTLYMHDYAVCVHASLESGVKGSYLDGKNNRQIEEMVKNDLEQKLSARLLWIEDKSVEIEANTLQIRIRISGKGTFLPGDGVETEQHIYRIYPCETLRRSRWLGV